VRQFSADYLDRTRRGMWADDRTALTELSLPTRERVLDIGCGTGELTAVLGEETDATVVGVDADTELLAAARDRLDTAGGDTDTPTQFTFAAGDATRLPFPTDSFDLVVCQALLVNLPEPAVALREFARVSRDLVAAVEPDNADVAVSSTVDSEAGLEREARGAFIDGVATDVTTQALSETFADAGLSDVRTRRYHHEKRVEPPYSEADLAGATRKATGAALASHETELRRALSDDSYDDLRQRWRAMGRAVVDQMRAETYERVEVVPFDVAVGRV
jgi:SAM-dependent methyltransferase